MGGEGSEGEEQGCDEHPQIVYTPAVRPVSQAARERAWCLYDWGNSAFATVCMTALLPPYLVSLVDAGHAGTAGVAVWGWTAAAGLMAGVVLGPLLGVVADGRGLRRPMLAGFAAVGAVATALLAVVLPGSWIAGAGLYVIAATGFAGANIFYDALLPSLAPSARWDSISSRGFAWGYAGGGIVLAAAAVMALRGGGGGVRGAFVLVAVWWGVFTVPVVTLVPEPAVEGGTVRGVARLRRTFREARSMPAVWGFLLAYWLYSDGIGTIIKMAAAYGASVGIPLAHMLGALLLTQLIGVPATLGFGRLGGRIGARRGILIALAGYVVITGFGYVLARPWQFWVLAGLVGLVQGGAQALSRSLFARLLPTGREAEFFSFFDVSSRMAGVVGPVLFAVAVELGGSTRSGVPVVMLLIGAGALLLARLPAAPEERATLEAPGLP